MLTETIDNAVYILSERRKRTFYLGRIQINHTGLKILPDALVERVLVLLQRGHIGVIEPEPPLRRFQAK